LSRLRPSLLAIQPLWAGLGYLSLAAL